MFRIALLLALLFALSEVSSINVVKSRNKVCFFPHRPSFSFLEC